MPGIGPSIGNIGIPVWESSWPQAPVAGSRGLEGAEVQESSPRHPAFTSYLKQAIDDINSLQLEADAASRAMLTGEISDIHRVTIAAEKANLAMQLAIEVRNKVLEAYQEIMRMQV